MIDIKDVISNRKLTSAKGGEKNFIIHQFIVPLNTARKAQNARNYRIARKTNPKLTREDFKRGKAYLSPLGHGRIVKEIKRAYGEWDKISPSDLYRLLSICNQSDDFAWTFWTRLKKAREMNGNSIKTLDDNTPK